MSILTAILIYLACLLAPSDTKEITIDVKPKEGIILNKAGDSKWSASWFERNKKEPMCELIIKELIMQVTMREKILDLDVLKLMNVKSISEAKALKEFKIGEEVYTIQKTEKSITVTSSKNEIYIIKW